MRQDQTARMKELREKYLVPIEQAAQRMFGTPDGKKVLEALERVFADDAIPKDGNGAVDANAVLVAAGSLQVINYLRRLAEPKEGQGT